ncbi:hypothetical protein KR018_003146 [Drosophila ironensis]|nr:hypothetical protein KR018_003146 [Drosophila ironensis]
MLFPCPSPGKPSYNFSRNFSFGDLFAESDEEEETESKCPTTTSSSQGKMPLGSRTDYALLEYKHFKAARMIQRHVRGWLCRRELDIKNKAAIMIQKWWLGFKVRRIILELTQNLLQLRTMQFFDSKATKIQSLFRGWLTRRYLQDFEAMYYLRMQCAEDFLSVIARSMYRLKQDGMIPGIYSLRESALLIKIEDLASTFTYRFHNGRVRAALAMKRAYINERRREFKSAIMYSLAPYPGPTGEMLPGEYGTLLTKQIGTSGQRVYLVYDRAIRDPFVKKLYNKFALRRRNSMDEVVKNQTTLFCNDLIRRLRPNKRFLSRSDDKTINDILEDILLTDDDLNCYCIPKDPRDTLCP